MCRFLIREKRLCIKCVPCATVLSVAGFPAFLACSPLLLGLFWAHIPCCIMGGSHFLGIFLRTLSYVSGIRNVVHYEGSGGQGLGYVQQ